MSFRWRTLFCHNHILQDVERKVHDAAGITTTDVSLYVNHVADLFKSESWPDYNLKYKKHSQKWIEFFKAYYNKKIAKDVGRAARLYTNKFPAFDECLPTNNCSESFHSAQKQNQNGEQQRLDRLVLTSLKFQLNYVSETVRTLNGGRNYTLMPQYVRRKCPIDPIPKYL